MQLFWMRVPIDGLVDRIVLEPHGAEIETQVRETLNRNGFHVNRYRSVLFAERQ